MKKLLTALLLSAATSAFGASYYTGGSVGYLVDSKDAYFTGRFGVDVAKTNTLVHSVEAEIGYTRDSDSGLKLDLVPVMVNYRLTAPLAQSKFSLYVGAGLGASQVKLSGWGYHDNDWAFTFQTFAGVEYSVTPTVSLTAGGRYLNIGTASVGGIRGTVGDDGSLEAGIRIRF
jgi:opacity protein-like surface antigen